MTKRVKLVADTGEVYELTGAAAEIVEYAARSQGEINGIDVGQVAFNKNGGSLHMTLQKIVNYRGDRRGPHNG